MLKYIFFLLPAFAFGQNQSLPSFTLPDVSTGKPYTLASCNGCSAMVVLFTSNECPYDQHYRERMLAMQKEFSGKAGFVWINSYVEAPEATAVMQKDAQQWGLAVPYLADKEQQVMELFGARKSPEVFLLLPAGSGWKVAYHGAIDDNPQVVNDVHENYLADAIRQVLAGKPVATPEERAVGCSIRRR